LVVHGKYGAPLIEAARALVGPLEAACVEVPERVSRERLLEAIGAAAAGQAREGEVLLLVDLHGSTPANVCLELLAQHPEWELVSGVSLPMLVKLSTCDRGLMPCELAHELRRTGQRCVQLGADLLHKGEPGGD